MRLKPISFPLLAALLLCGCSSAVREEHREPPEVMKAVPSDAVVIVSCPRLSNGLEQVFDSTDVLRSLAWGKLSGHEAAIAFINAGKLSPLVCVDAGKASADTSAGVSMLLEQAGRHHMKARYCCGDDHRISRNILLIAESEAVISNALRHVEAGESILGDNDFLSAFRLSGGREAVFIRNSGIAGVIPRGYLSGMFDRKQMLKFLANAAEWIIAVPRQSGCEIMTFQHEDDSQFANMLGKMNDGECRISEILPENVEYAFSLPVAEGFREVYQNWRYSCSNLDKYSKEIERIRKVYGVKALDWEKERVVREAGIIQFGGGRRIIALRADNPGNGSEAIEANPAPGMVAALYGKAFSTARDSCRYVSGNWILYGSKETLENISHSGTCDAGGLWPEDGCRFAIWQPGRIFYSGHNGSFVKIEK